MINIEGVDYLTATEAAEMLDVKVSTLYSYASRGRIQSYRRGIKRDRFYRRDDIEALLRMRPALQASDQADDSPATDHWPPRR